MNVQSLERCFTDRIDKEMGNIFETVEDRTQNSILTAIDNNIAPRIELAVRSKKEFPEREAASVTANSELGEQFGITACFENVSDKNNMFHGLNANDETRGNILDEVSEFLVVKTHFDR